MSSSEIVAQIMYDVEFFREYFPLRNITIIMSRQLYLRIQLELTVHLVNGCAALSETLFGVPIETTNGSGEYWYVGIKGMMPKEEI